MAITDTRHRFSVNIGGRVYATDNLRDPDILEQCSLFCREAFGPADPAKATLNLIKAGVELAPLMTRGDVEKLIELLQQKMMSRARVR